MRLALTGGTLVRSLEPPIVGSDDVLLEGGRIAGVGVPIPEGTPRRDCSGCLVVPGNVCAHTHLYSALARGMPGDGGPPPRTFVEILRRVWWRLDRALDDETIRVSALVAGLDALRAGTTTVIDHHASPAAVDGSLDVIAEALGQLGLRSVLCYETSDRDGPNVARAGLAENARFVAATEAGAWPLARAMVGAHASFTLGEDALQAVAELASHHGCGVHVHVAEDAEDERHSLATYGTRVVRRLFDAGALDQRSLLAHGVHLDASETELIHGTRATVVHNPRSNLNNAVGRPPLALLGARVALGTDGIGADMFEEARTAFLGRRAEDVGTAPSWALERLARAATVAGGAFDEPRLGRIEPGAPADLAILDTPVPTPLDETNLAAHWIFGFAAGSVRDVIVQGQVVVADRQVLTVDGDEVAAAARPAARRLWNRLESIPEHPFMPSSAMAANARR
jgi:putative selenium metabolism protein SsnA